MDPSFTLVNLIHFVIRALVFIIFVDAILTWIPSLDRNNTIVVALRRTTEPIYRPIRKLIPPSRFGIDLSPLIAIIALQIIDWLIFVLL